MQSNIQFLAADVQTLERIRSYKSSDRVPALHRSCNRIDLPHRLSPADLDLLTQELADLLGASVPHFRRCLHDHTLGDPAFSVVSLRWVELLAAIKDKWMPETAWAWANWMADNRSLDEVESIETLSRCVKEIAHLCRCALVDGMSVVVCYAA